MRSVGAPSGTSGTVNSGVRSMPWAFQLSTASAASISSACPMASSIVRKPSSARYSRTSSATNQKKFSTNSGLPV